MNVCEIFTRLQRDERFRQSGRHPFGSSQRVLPKSSLSTEINLDFNDVKTVLKDGGVAIMSTGYGEGENRVSQAINNALHSPLLNNNDIFNSKKDPVQHLFQHQ